MNNTTQDSKLTAKEVWEGMSKDDFWRSDIRDISDNPKDSSIPFAIVVPYIGACEPIADICSFPPISEKELQHKEANAEAIIQAVNGTWLKGINPNTVPEMLTALHNCIVTLEAINDYAKIEIAAETISNAKLALENATIK